MRTIGHGPAGPRHDVRAGAVAGRPPAASWPTSSSSRATSPTPTPSSSSSGCSCSTPPGRSTSTTTTRRCARTSRRSRSSCPRCCTTSPGRAHAGARRARHEQRDAVRADGARRRSSWGWPTARPRCTRSPWPAGAARLQAESTACGRAQHLPTRLAAARTKYAAYLENEVGEPVSDRRAPEAIEPTIADLDRLWPPGWTPRASGPARRWSTQFMSGGSQNEIYEVTPRRRARRRCGSPRRPRAGPGRGHRARVAHHRGPRRHRRPAHRRHRACATDTSVLGRTFYLMGFVDGWSPMGLERRPDGPAHGPSRSTPTSRQRRGLAFQLVEGIALLSKVDWQAQGLADLGRPEGSTSGRSTAGRRSSSGSRAASCPAATRPRRGCGRTGRSTTSPASCTATTSSPTSCSRTAPPPGWPPSSTGRWAPSATPSSTSAGSSTPGPRTPAAAAGGTGGKGPSAATSTSPACRRAASCSTTTPRSSGRQVDDIDYYNILASWKLAIVLEQGYQRAGDDEKLQSVRPDRGRPDARRGRARRDDRLRLRGLMRAAVCREFGPPESISVEDDYPAPALSDGSQRRQ